MNRRSKIKCGYCGSIINVGSCANIKEHKCFENYKEESHLLHIDENHVAKIIPRYGYNENSTETNTTTSADVAVIPIENNIETKSDEGTDELLIELVFERPALWNYKIPLQDRTNLKKDALWLEISNRMGGGNATVKWAKTRWKDLRDAYVKARKKIKSYVPSGSDAATAKKLRKSSFRFFERMQFLEAILTTETTISSLPFESSTSLPGTSDSISQFDSICLDENSSEISHQLTSPKTPNHNEPISSPLEPISSSLSSNTLASSKTNSTRASKKRKHLDTIEQNDVEESLLEALRQPIKQPDAIDGMLLRLGEGLRRLPYRERTLLEIQWLRELMAAEERCCT